MIHGDAKSHARWISYALGILRLSVVSTKGLGSVTKKGMITAKATVKAGVNKVIGAAKRVPTLTSYAAPQHQLANVNVSIF